MKPATKAETFPVGAAAAALLAVCAVCAASAAEVKKEFADPREQFHALGVENKFFDRLADGGPIAGDERETLLRVLFRLRIFPTLDLKRWAMDPELLETALHQPKDYRGTVFRLPGRVLDVKPVITPPDAAERYELKYFYRCRLKLDAFDKPVIVYTETVPNRWRKGATPDASGSAMGVFLKLTEGGTPLFAAPRLAWYPNNTLGRLGMDFGLLDTVVFQQPLVKEDRAAFYAMLAAAGRSKPGSLLRQAESNLPKTPAKWRWTDDEGEELYSVVPLFNEPKTQQGRLVALRGAARLVEEVHVEPEVAAEFGIDHYYQLMLVTDDSQGNPLTFCVLELPEGMPYGNIPRYGESVLVAGFFFKTWSYPVRRPPDEAVKPGESKTRMQLSPLLIGRSLAWRPPPKPADQTRINIIVGVLFIAAMFVVWFVAWRSMRREHRWVDQAIGGPPKDFSPPEGK